MSKHTRAVLHVRYKLLIILCIYIFLYIPTISREKISMLTRNRNSVIMLNDKEKYEVAFNNNYLILLVEKNNL